MAEVWAFLSGVWGSGVWGSAGGFGSLLFVSGVTLGSAVGVCSEICVSGVSVVFLLRLKS